MADDLLSQAASATEGMVPGMTDGKDGSLTSFSPQMPQMLPIPQYKPPEQQFGKAGNEFQTVSGRKRADRQALISNTINLFKSITDYTQAKKMRSLQMDITKLMEASQGINEAKSVLQDPNASPQQKQQAQAALQQNTLILNTIAGDTKKAKNIMKAFNIDLFGQGKNKNENQAFMNAFKEFQQKQAAGDKTALNPMAQAIMSSMPVRQGMSPEMMMQAQAVKSGLIPTANAQLKAYVDTQVAISRAKSAEERTAAIQAHDKVLEANAKLIAGAKDKQVQAYLERTLMMRMNSQDRDKVMLSIAQIKSADNDKRIAALTSIAGEKSLNEKDRNILGSLNKEATTYNNQIKVLLDENNKLTADLAKTTKGLLGIPVRSMNDTDARIARNKIGMNNMAIKKYQQDFDSVQSKINVLNQMGITTMRPEESETPGSSEQDPIEFDPNKDDSEE